jgi:hypothetical protein
MFTQVVGKVHFLRVALEGAQDVGFQESAGQQNVGHVEASPDVLRRIKRAFPRQVHIDHFPIGAFRLVAFIAVGVQAPEKVIDERWLAYKLLLFSHC